MNTDQTPCVPASAETIEPSSSILRLIADFLRLLKPDMRNQKRSLLAAYIVSLFGIAGSYCGPLFLSDLLDKSLPNRDLRLLFWYGGAALLSMAVFLICSMLRTYFLAAASELMFLALRTRVTNSVLKMPASFFTMHETGDLITRISNDAESLSILVFDYIYAGLNNIIMIVAFVALMLAWEWRLGLYTVLTLPCYVLLLMLLQGPLYRAANAARKKFSIQNETLLDIISGVRELRLFQQFQAASRRFEDSASQYTHANIRSVQIGEWAFNAMEFFARFSALIPFLLGGYWICSGTSSLTIGTLIAYNLYIAYIATGLEGITVGVTKLAQASPLISRLKELLDYPEEERAQIESLAEIPENTRIEFINVSFSHNPAKLLLKDFSISIDPSEKLAIMGPSGSGKSTLIDLLSRQRRPHAGEILFGGRPIETYGLNAYLLNLGYVPQKPYLFKTSVRNNIAMGWYNIPLDVVMQMAERVGMHEAIMRLPQGYDTIIGSGGINLSGGQLQRLALARALARDPAVLLLDEFTSALDHETEEEILKDLFESFARQTIICVTHSQSVANHFSRIVKMEKP